MESKIVENQELEQKSKPEKNRRNMTDEQRQKQREHLNNIRQMAMDKKKQLKEITLKSKLAKTVVKQDLAKQYDAYIENKVKEKTKTVEPIKKPVEDDSDDSNDEIIIKKSKSKSKPKKKIVYVSESESEEEVIIKKPKAKAKQPTLEHLVYNNTKDQLYNRMIEERVRNSIIGYGNALGV